MSSVTSIAPDTAEAVRFLLAHAGNALTTITGIVPDGGTVTRTFSPDQTDELGNFIEKHQRNRNLYYSVNPVRRPLRKKASKDDIKCLAWVHVDCDPRAGYDREAERDRILQNLQRFTPQPHVILDSGNGYQALWRLRHPLPNGGDYEALEALNRRLKILLGADSCHNIDRILRIPGTLNLPTAKKRAKDCVPVLATVVREEPGTCESHDFPNPPDRLEELLADKKIRMRWNGNGHGLKDTSRSGFDLSLVGRLHRRGATRDETKAILGIYPFGQYSETRDERQFDRCWEKAEESTSQDQQDHGIIEELNREFALILVGDKVAVLVDEPKRPINLLSVAAFCLWLRNRQVWTTGSSGQPKSTSAGNLWLAHPRRRQYKQLVFAPGLETPSDTFNVWRGFGTIPKAGDCSLFVSHLRDNVCRGNNDLFEWVFGWFAQLFQQPAIKLGTALVLRGRAGTGKTFVGRTMQRLLGEAHYKLASSPRYITGRFNAHLISCLLLHSDEGFWAGNHEAEGILKDLITNDTQLIEYKGKEVIEVRNYIRLLVTSEHDWVVPAGLRDRRFTVLDVGEEHIQDTKYFGAIQQQLNHGGYEALLYDLLHFSYSDEVLRQIPKTAAHQEQLIATLPPEEGWIADLLMNALLPGDWDGVGQSPAEILYDSYLQRTARRGISRKAIEMKLSIFLRNLFPEIGKRQRGYIDWHGNERSGMVWTFPSLGDARTAFEKHVGNAMPWGAIEAWLPTPRPDPETF